MAQLDQLVDGTKLRTLPAADQTKYQEQPDGTYKLIGDATPSAETDAKQFRLILNKTDYQALPDELKPYYMDKYTDVDGKPVEDGTYKLRGYEDTNALKNALGHVRAERDMAREKLKEFDGFDAEELKRLQKVSADLAQEKELQRSNFDKQFTEAAEQYKTEIKLRDERNATLKRDLEHALIDNQAEMDIKAHGGKTKMLLPHVTKHVEVREIEGRHVAVVVGDDGKPRLRKGATKATDFLPITEYIEELREDPEFASAFSSSGASGGGATKTGQTTDGAPATISKHDLQSFGANAEAIAKGKTKVV